MPAANAFTAAPPRPAPAAPAPVAPTPRAPAPSAGRRRRRGSPRWLLLVPLTLIGASLYSWAKVAHLDGPGAALTAAGQATGLLTTVFALCTVVLMARLPVVTNFLGMDRGLRWHRWSATATMVFLPTHIAAITLGYAAAEKKTFTEQFTSFLTTMPDMLTATAAAVLFLVVATTSIRYVRRRFRYATWLFIHWYSYAAVALAFGHEVAVGSSFVRAPWATLAWTWLHLFLLGLVLWYRVVKPVMLMLTHPLHVGSIGRVAHNAVAIELRGEDLHDYRVEAGHHVRVRFLTKNGWWQSHPFSLSAVPQSEAWRITVVGAGDHTRWMQGIRMGTPCYVSGAYGHLTHRPGGRHVALIGGGAGITPLRALLEVLPGDVDARVLYRARSWEDVLHPEELDHLARQRGGDVKYLLGPRHPDPAQDVLSPPSLLRLLPDITSRDVYVCGLAGFVDTVDRALQKAKVPRKQIHLERYDP
jgi:predicted ferric reductase